MSRRIAVTPGLIAIALAGALTKAGHAVEQVAPPASVKLHNRSYLEAPCCTGKGSKKHIKAQRPRWRQ